MILLLMSLILVTCGSDSNKSQRTPKTENVRYDVYDITGKGHRLDEWIGKQPVVLNFWGTWCGPCRREIPSLVKLYGEFAPKGVEMIGLAVKDKPEKVQMFSQQYGMTWVMLMANREVLTKFRVISGIPQTIFLDKNGTEVRRYVGAKPYEALKQGFEAIL
ncbi:MAG: TlpA family protein disulfide reductase [Candidatus Zixiibacteriota bacterium]